MDYTLSAHLGASARPDKTPVAVDPKSIVDLIANYTYGQFNILDNGMGITYNRKTCQVKFDPFYTHGMPAKSGIISGTCVELMNAAYVAIRAKHPEYHVLRVQGNDPEYFLCRDDAHFYLLVSETDLLGGKPVIETFNEIEKVVSKDPLLVDPSFQRVVPFSNSGYRVEALWNQGCKMGYSTAMVMFPDEGVPIGFNLRGELVYLFVDSVAAPVKILK
ncbi:hypothetical protein HZB02_03510 [Candidatus Woesearchaeota archaeon]|nr:hypothetical protein [Candidatus Woesearchaeota archaeon]